MSKSPASKKTERLLKETTRTKTKGKTVVKAKSEVSTVEAWKKVYKETYQKTKMIILPFAKVTVEVRVLDLLERASIGDIPLKLVADSMKFAKKLKTFKEGEEDIESLKDIDPSELKGMLDLYEKVAIIAVVNPIVTEDGSDNTMNVHEISSIDKQAIFLATSDTEGNVNLNSFREE